MKKIILRCIDLFSDAWKALFFAGLVFITTVQCDSKQESDKIPVAIIPQPTQMQIDDNGYFVIDSQTKLYVKGDSGSIALTNDLASFISASSLFEINANIDKDMPAKNSILLHLDSDAGSRGYSLVVTGENIVLTAGNNEGLFYGVQTLRQLMKSSVEAKVKIEKSWVIPLVTINDIPAYSWRGMHLDVSRHFFSIEFVKRFIDRLALYKMNKLHLHLTDDQGWRMQINRYPQLTEDGAWRIFNNQDSVCMRKSSLDPDFALPEEFIKEKDGLKVYGGYYSQNDIKEIVAYADKHFVTIIPEIDMPGHMNAAILPMPELTCVDGSGWGKLFTIPLCPCEETTYTFIENVLTEVASLFPGKYIHIGADEVDESSWLKSKACTALMKKEGLKTTQSLHGYFVNRVNKIVSRLGKKTIGWDEILESGSADTSITMMYWRGWIKDAPLNAVYKGHSVIMSPTSHCYFDYAPDQKTLEGMYNFDPAYGLNDQETKKIIGLQANIWTEYIPTVSRLDYMTMPRMMALAEVGWSKTKNWNDFKKRLGRHFNRLDILGIHYRLPDLPGLTTNRVFIDTAIVKLTKPEGISEIRYTVDGSEPTNQSDVWTKSLTIDSTMVLKVRTFGYQGRVGNIYTVKYEKQGYLQTVEKEAVKDGLKCRYYEGEYSTVSKIENKDFKDETIVRNVLFPTTARPNVFALEFTGFIQMPEDGIYTFYLSSDDGSTLNIGNSIVVNHDGFHGDVEKSGQIALRKGLHPILVRYFDGGGGKSLKLQYEGPAINKQEVPDSLFKHVTDK